MLRICILTLSIVLSTNLGHSQNLTQDDSLIYITIIKSVVPPSANTVLIINETVKYEHVFDTASIVDSNSTDPDEILTRKYEWENATKTPFDSIAYNPMVRYYLSDHVKRRISYKFPLPFRVVYLSGQEYEIGKESGEYWDNLDSMYSNSDGLFSFSRIFYSTDGSRAIVYYAIRRKNGKGSVLVLQKINGRWEIKAEIKAWYN